MWLGQKTRRKIFIAAGFILFTWIIVSFFGSMGNAAEREPVFMSKVLDAPNTTEIYNQLSLKIKASKPFKICLKVYTTTDEYYWIIYSATNDDPTHDPMERLIEQGIGSDLVNSEWQTITRDIQLDLEEQAGLDLKYIKKIEILGTDFGIRYVTVFCEKEINGWSTIDYHINTNFNDSLEDPLDEMGWEANDPYCFSLEYDNLDKYLQALGPLPESENKESSSYNYAPDSIFYSPTDFGSYYSPYSTIGGYYDNYYGSYGYGGYGGYGLGYGLGYGYPALGGGYGLPLYGGAYGGYGLGGFGLPYSGYGSLSPLAGIIGNPIGLGLSPYTGLGLGSLGLFGGLNSPWTDSSKLIEVDFSTSLALQGANITELSGFNVLINPEYPTFTLPQNFFFNDYFND